MGSLPLSPPGKPFNKCRVLHKCGTGCVTSPGAQEKHPRNDDTCVVLVLQTQECSGPGSQPECATGNVEVSGSQEDVHAAFAVGRRGSVLPDLILSRQVRNRSLCEKSVNFFSVPAHFQNSRIMGLPDIAKKNTGHPVQCEFQRTKTFLVNVCSNSLMGYAYIKKLFAG